MKGQTLVFVVLCATLNIVFGSPLQQSNSDQPKYKNLPRCFQPPESGICLAYFPSFYYNPSKKTCEDFIYGGCKGNENRFITFEACMEACEGAEPEKQDFKLIPPSEINDPCSQSSDTGPCKASLQRYYFNTDKCESFVYGGCQGNENNFKSLEECQQKCGTKTSEESNEDEPSSEKESEETSEEQSQSEESEENE